MAGTFPGVSNTQQQDINGLPMAGCLLTVFNGASATLASLFSDIGLTIPLPNPLVGLLDGRIPLFFVADGIYRIRLTDSTGVTTNGGFDYSQVPSIGPSSGGGGGGGSVDPTTVATTGDIKPRLTKDIVTGWVRINGKTIGSGTSGATERANTDTAALYSYIWNNFSDSICPVSTGRGANAAADFAANKTITLFDLRGRTLAGYDDMGSASASRLAAALFGNGDAITVGSAGGEAAHTLAIGEMPSHDHGGATGNPTTHPNLGVNTDDGNQASAGGARIASDILQAATLPDHVHTISAQGGGGAHNNMPPFTVCNWLWKL